MGSFINSKTLVSYLLKQICCSKNRNLALTNGLRVVSVGYWYIITSFAIGSLSFPESKKSFGRDQKSKAE